VRVPPALRHRDFRLLVAGYIPGHTGEYIQQVVQNWLVWELTHSAFYLGLIGFCQFAPRFVFSPLGGVIADRVDRRKLLILTQILQALQTGVFAFLVFSGWIQFWHISLLVIFLAIVNSVNSTATQVLVCSTVPQETVVSALALNSASHNLTKIVGPSLGGVLIALIGSGNCLLIHLFTIFFMLGAVLLMRGPSFTPPGVRGRWLKDVAEGLSYARQNRRLLSTLLITYSNGFFGISYLPFLPFFAEEVLHVGSSGYGLLMAAPGVGAVIMSVFLSIHAQVRRMRYLLVASSILYAASIFFFSISRIMVLSLILLAVVGSMQMSYRVLARAIVQEESPPALLGRMMSLFFLDRGFGSLGSVAIGTLAALITVAPAVALSAALCGVTAWVVPRIYTRRDPTS
jgi:predicted MFS family arabinose efflux permease